MKFNAKISFLLTCFLAVGLGQSVVAQMSDVGSQILKGTVINKASGDPVVFANVYKIGSTIGTVANAQGEFELKLPQGSENDEIGISFIGFKPESIKVESFLNKEVAIALEPSPIKIDEVVIRSEDPIDLILLARKKISENYSNAPFMLTAFYREIVMQNKRYVGIAEAVLDVYKSSYINDYDVDRVKIFKGRKSMNVKKMDTVLFKLQGGPKTSFLLDVVKNPGGLLSDDFIKDYNYAYNGIIQIDERQTYVISFNQKAEVPYPLYSGKIYLDATNMAISGVEFHLSENGIEHAADFLVKKRPSNMNVEVEGGNYLVSYREINGKWYFNNIRSELNMNCRWNKKLFKSKYNVRLEMAVTDMDFDNVMRYKLKEASKLNDVLADQVDYFADTDFWGGYNTILPEQSLESAIEKLNRKVLR